MSLDVDELSVPFVEYTSQDLTFRPTRKMAAPNLQSVSTVTCCWLNETYPRMSYGAAGWFACFATYTFLNKTSWSMKRTDVQSLLPAKSAILMFPKKIFQSMSTNAASKNFVGSVKDPSDSQSYSSTSKLVSIALSAVLAAPRSPGLARTSTRRPAAQSCLSAAFVRKSTLKKT